MINFKGVLHILGALMALLGAFMLLPLLVTLTYEAAGGKALLLSALITGGVGAVLWASTRKVNKRIGKREGYLVVATAWVFMSLFSSLPYLISGALPDMSHAIFESVSGLSTTGASVVQDIEALPRDILFWRSLTQWIGGMGIIVLTVALLPLLGIGGVELFVAEAPGPTSDKIHPRIKETAKRLWFIYVGLTLLLSTLLWMLGMTPYDAINHGLTTMATGGFSTKNASMAHFGPAIQYTVMAFMFMAGVNYTVIYYGLRGNFKKVWQSNEFQTYLYVTGAFVVIATTMVYQQNGHHLEQAFRDATFQIVSLVTTTGFVSADYTAWHPALTIMFFGMLFLGACAGSTSGGIKVIRHLVFFKSSLLEFKRLLHPKGVIRIKIDGQLVAPRILTHILVFLLLYLILFMLGRIVMAFILSDWERPLLTAAGAAATALGNVGPGIGELGPVDNFAQVPNAGKWFLTILMLLGRLELFTILILFSPYFWRRN